MSKHNNVSEVGMQASSGQFACVVDAVSCKDLDNICPEAAQLAHQIETHVDVESVILDMHTLSDDTAIDRLLKEKFICAICHGLLVRARVLNCGHHFCRECLYYWFRLRHMCPMCRSPGNMSFPSPYTDSFLDDVVMHSNNEVLTVQRTRRKLEKASACLDTSNTVGADEPSGMMSSYAQTVSSYSHGVTTDNWTQAAAETSDRAT
ncbi:RING finger protein [Paragonimus heterotremus]|uniref:RING finger protein n=1 Tax=Paragonimus heterotremus TaxID=100268 RepID=A0A8J4WG04_9TREM|nr:RING finger protein [Paragonimus heterotremus]